MALLAATMAALVTSASEARGRPPTPRTAWVDVSVATLWTSPGAPRAIDRPALGDPVHIERWLRDTSTEEKRWLSEHDATQTQALYGARVEILAARPGWYEVAVPGQPTPRDSRGYPGWVPADQLSLQTRYGRAQQHEPVALVDRAATAWLYGDSALTHRRVKLSYDTRLPAIGHGGTAIEVALPGGGSGWLAARAASVYASPAAIPAPTGADLVRAARLFLGRPYLWGGTSGFAFDCSGLTHAVYDAHGITIPRDAGAQATFTGHGRRIARSDLEPGDLLFYAGAHTIDHVAMYVGRGKMIEAYGAGVEVRITPVRFGETYWGAERFL